MTKSYFRVSIEIPSGCSKEEMKDYIKDSVQSMRSCLYPGDPLFSLNRDSVKVSYLDWKRINRERNTIPSEYTRSLVENPRD